MHGIILGIHSSRRSVIKARAKNAIPDASARIPALTSIASTKVDSPKFHGGQGNEIPGAITSPKLSYFRDLRARLASEECQKQLGGNDVHSTQFPAATFAINELISLLCIPVGARISDMQRTPVSFFHPDTFSFAQKLSTFHASAAQSYKAHRSYESGTISS